MTHVRCPTGWSVDAEVRVSVREDRTPAELEVRLYRRSPSDLSADAFTATGAGFSVQLQFAETLIEAISKAAAAHPSTEDAAAWAIRAALAN
jgi:hypothetical protein